MKNQKGFSLIELLVVIIIIGIIAAIAIPSLLSSRRTANEATAIATLRNLHTAEATYLTTQAPASYGTFANLTGANLIDASFNASPVVKNNYTFAITMGTGNTGFCITATSAGASTGNRSFSISHQGALYQSVAATPLVPPTCDEDTGVISTGTVVGS